MTIETQLVTIAEFEAFIAKPENAGRHFELINGEIVEDIPTLMHAAIVMAIAFQLRLFINGKTLGWVLPEARYKIPGDDHNTLIPDLSFVSKARGTLTTTGAADFLPDLAIEVQSPGQSDQDLIDKGHLYLKHGVRLVWLVYPKNQLVEVLLPDDRKLYSGQQVFTGEDVLPGFEMTARAMFDVDADSSREGGSG